MEFPPSKEPACGRSHATFDGGNSIGWSASQNNPEVTMQHPATGFDDIRAMTWRLLHPKT
jgi:hypothetical protein